MGNSRSMLARMVPLTMVHSSVPGWRGDRKSELAERETAVAGKRRSAVDDTAGVRPAALRATARSDRSGGALPFELRKPKRVHQQAADAERVAVASPVGSNIAAKSAIASARGGPDRAAMACSWAQVTRPSSGSCCPIDATSGRDRSMLSFQYIRLGPPYGGT